MKKFTKKSIQQKIIISILAIVLAINFIIPTYSHADIGGVLMDPITDLLCTVGDAVINLLQKCMTGDWGSNDFSLFHGGFLRNSDEPDAFDSAPTGREIGEINVSDPENGFNRKWLGGDKLQTYYVPVATYSPEQIFSGNVAGLDINFINPKDYGEGVKSSAQQLHGAISSWYVALRNLTVVVLLSVLVYVGIRIIISSTASDKAKYKKMLGDWVIALCLVFFLHYIMSFTLTVTESISSAIAGQGDSTVSIKVTDTENGIGGYLNTNLLGAARFKTQYNDFGQKMAYLIMYLALVIYTVIFTWFYLKRLLMMAFLTIISPLVALTYPIDKISDGKAQAFDSWLKEYVFNALIQPFHLIIYTVFVGTAMDLASTNIIYTIAALGFILPAEKILRKFFGFDKAGATLGTLGALGLGSMASKLLGGSKGGKKGISGGGTSGSSDNKPTRFQGNPNINDMLDGENGSDNSESSNSSNTNTNNTNDDSDQINPFGDQEMADYYNDPNAGLGDEQSIDERMEEIYQAQGDNAFYDPEYLELQRKKEEEAARAAAESTSRQEDDEPEDEPEEKQEKNHKIIKGFKNLGTYYGPKLGRGALNAAKATGEIAFKGAAGTLAGAVAMASGGGLAGGIAAFAAGSNVAGGVINTVGTAGRAIPQMARNVSDVWNGDFSASKKEERKQWEKENYDTYRKEIAKGNGGYLPSSKEMKQKYQELDDYYNAGLRDIKDMLKAQKLELKGVDSKQAALAAALQQQNNYSKSDLSNDIKVKRLEKTLANQVDSSISQAQRKNIAHQTVNLMKEKEGVPNDGKFPKKKS